MESLNAPELDVPRSTASRGRSRLRCGSMVLLLIVTAVGLTALAPDQPRAAAAADAPSLAYTALGDSFTVKAGYVNEYADYVSTELGLPVTLANLGLIGYTSGGLSYRLANDQTFRDSVSSANLITVMIGINDAGLARLAYENGTCGGADNQDCLRNTENAFRDNFTAILSQIRALNGKHDAAVLVADVFNPRVQQQTDDGTLGVFIPFYSAINADIHSISSANGIGVAGVYQAFNGADGTEDAGAKGYLMPDGHANELGHQEIAALFENTVDMSRDGDADGDGLANGSEKDYGTNPLMDDTDGDALSDAAEMKTYSTNPLVGDTDGDGCTDGKEVGPDRGTGGQRDPNNPWDYFNPSHDGQNRMDDVLLVAYQYYKDNSGGIPGLASYTKGEGYTADTDRTLLGPNAWNLGPPDGVQRIDDVLNIMRQFWDDCS